MILIYLWGSAVSQNHGSCPDWERMEDVKKHHVVSLHRNVGKRRTFLIGNTAVSNLSAVPT